MLLWGRGSHGPVPAGVQRPVAVTAARRLLQHIRHGTHAARLQQQAGRARRLKGRDLSVQR